MKRSRVALLSVVILALLAPAALAATPFEQTYNAYRKHGSVPPCQFSAGTLQKAKAEVPPDIEQYAPDFPAALDAALQARAAGACGRKGSTGAVTPAGAPAATPGGGNTTPPAAAAASSPTATATPAPTPLPASAATPISAVAAAKHGGGASAAPAPVIAVAIVLVALALGALWWSLTTWRGLEPGWLLGARHAWGEAAYRAGGTWAEFTDWVRLGR